MLVDNRLGCAGSGVTWEKVGRVGMFPRSRGR